MTLTQILRELQHMLHDSDYSLEDKHRIVLAHNQLMKVFEGRDNDKQNQ